LKNKKRKESLKRKKGQGEKKRPPDKPLTDEQGGRGVKKSSGEGEKLEKKTNQWAKGPMRKKSETIYLSWGGDNGEQEYGEKIKRGRGNWPTTGKKAG